MFKKLFTQDNKWFFSNPHPLLRFLLIFVKGDAIVLLPLVITILLVGFISTKFMFLLIGIYISVRYLGEMIYWINQQFGPKTYRPYDFGFKNLNNEAIYIIYQTLAIGGIVFGAAIVSFVLLYIK